MIAVLIFLVYLKSVCATVDHQSIVTVHTDTALNTTQWSYRGGRQVPWCHSASQCALACHKESTCHVVQWRSHSDECIIGTVIKVIDSDDLLPEAGVTLFTKPLAVFHASPTLPRYSFSCSHGKMRCRDIGTTMATAEAARLAYNAGFSACTYSWVLENNGDNCMRSLITNDNKMPGDSACGLQPFTVEPWGQLETDRFDVLCMGPADYVRSLPASTSYSPGHCTTFLCIQTIPGVS